MNMTELSKKIHADNVKQGFYDDTKDIPPYLNDYFIFKQLMLIVTEIGEAAEALRKDGIDNSLELPIKDCTEKYFIFETNYKDKFQDELGDSIIRILDLCGYLDIDIDEWVNAKLEYNRTRAYKHGKKY